MLIPIRILATAVIATSLACRAGSSGLRSDRASELQTMRHDGRDRSFLVRVPPEPVHGGTRVPVVIVLHGGGGNAFNAETMTGFTELARREGFLVVYPNGSGRRRNALLTWNAGHCCGYAMEQRIDDVGFIDALIDHVVARYAGDPRRIYVTGLSNGGMMTHRIGIALSRRVTAIAPVIATLFGDEVKPRDPVPALMVNGVLDRMVPFEGGLSAGRFPDAWDGTPARPALDQATFWAEANGCHLTQRTVDHGLSRSTRFDCPPGREVELHAVEDNGHAWPGGRKGSRAADTPSTALDATSLIWSFFESHSRR